MPILDEIKWASTGGLKDAPPVRIQDSGYTTIDGTIDTTPEYPILQWDNYWRSMVYTNLETILNGTKVAIGSGAGATGQGDSAVAIGEMAGKTTQGGSSVAVGRIAGQTDQGADSVAIGVSCAITNQGASSVAIGSNSGKTNQGERSVAIGAFAGFTNQGDNGIIISSDQYTLSDETDGHIHIRSIAASLDYTAADKWNFTGGAVGIGGTDIGSSLFAVGSVQQSMLTEAQFQSEMGTQWVLMDGRSVSGSRYQTLTGSSTVPNAAGAFIRAAGGSAGTVGSIQSDATAKNGLGLTWSSADITTTTATASWSSTANTNSDAHTHYISRATDAYNGYSLATDVVMARSGDDEDRDYRLLGWKTSSGGANVAPTSSDSHSHTINKNQWNSNQTAHSHKFNKNLLNSNQNFSGDAETRPINIALYYYIKIN